MIRCKRSPARRVATEGDQANQIIGASLDEFPEHLLHHVETRLVVLSPRCEVQGLHRPRDIHRHRNRDRIHAAIPLRKRLPRTRGGDDQQRRARKEDPRCQVCQIRPPADRLLRQTTNCGELDARMPTLPQHPPCRDAQWNRQQKTPWPRETHSRPPCFGPLPNAVASVLR